MSKKPYSLSKKINNNVKSAVKFISDFENICIDFAIENKQNYVICGQIHEPKIENRITSKGKTIYFNSGDWIENRTALNYKNKKCKIHKYSAAGYKLTADDEERFEYENQLADQFMSIIK